MTLQQNSQFRQDKTNFISQKDHKATYIAIKEYSIHFDTLIELQQYALRKNQFTKFN